MDISSFKCKLRVVEAKNIDTKPICAYFIRCYISAGNGSRIQLNTREILSSEKDGNGIIWDETFSLECNGEHNSISNNLKDENIVFEMRLKNTNPNFLGVTGASQLLSRAELPWENVFESPNTEILKWVPMTRNETSENSEEWCLNPPALKVGIKVEIPELSREETKRKRRNERLKKNRDECGCSPSNGGSCSCVDNELLLVAEALDVFL